MDIGRGRLPRPRFPAIPSDAAGSLAIKTDSRNEFIGNGSGDLYPLWGVEQLLSPPYAPQYNGTCETGHGSIRYRAEMLARQDGQFGGWSLDHLESTGTWANDLPRVPQGPPLSRSSPAARPSARPNATSFVAPATPLGSNAGTNATPQPSAKAVPSLSQHHQPRFPGQPSAPPCAASAISTPGASRFVNLFRTKKRRSFRNEHNRYYS